MFKFHIWPGASQTDLISAISLVKREDNFVLMALIQDLKEILGQYLLNTKIELLLLV